MKALINIQIEDAYKYNEFWKSRARKENARIAFEHYIASLPNPSNETQNEFKARFNVSYQTIILYSLKLAKLGIIRKTYEEVKQPVVPILKKVILCDGAELDLNGNDVFIGYCPYCNKKFAMQPKVKY